MEITKIEKITKMPEGRPEDQYDIFLQEIKDYFYNGVQFGNVPLFNTNAEGLFYIFIDNLPEDARQHYTCRACAKFVNTYGGVVTLLAINPAKQNMLSICPVMWPKTVPEVFQQSVDAVRNYIINKTKITSIFYTHHITLGEPKTGPWKHMSVQIPRLESNILNPKHKYDYEAEAESKELYKMTCNGIAEYTADNVKTALQMVNSKAISGIGVVGPQCKWLDELFTAVSGLHSKTRSNAIWYYIAMTNPANCHIKSGMLGTLLDDIKTGENIQNIKAKFEDKMHPLKYMRVQSDANNGNIQAGEALFKKLGIGADALERTFATIDDLKCIWKELPKEKDEESNGIFGSLKAKVNKANTLVDWNNFLNKGPMTLEKFKKDILPYLEELKIQIPNNVGNQISTFLTAFNKESAPIFKYDNLEERNQVSYYLYSGGYKTIQDFGISSNGRYPISAICYDPQIDITKYSKGLHFVISGAHDYKADTHGNAIFPSDLRYELHEVRNTIENHSKDTKIVGDFHNGVCAYRLQDDTVYDTKYTPVFFAKTSNMGIVRFQIDRWE